MRMSQLFSQTSKEDPADAEVSSHKLLIRAGYIRQLAAGIFSYLPLAYRSLTKIENIMREEIDNIGGQEIMMPIVHPAELWQETGRWFQIGSEMGRFRDKNEREMVLSMTHEEVIADLTRKEIRSYRQLPQLLYHIQTKWRDDPRPRAGLIRAREFTMLDSYSLDRDPEGLNQQYQAHFRAYLRIFARCGIKVITVSSDVGMMGGQTAHEFMFLSPVGEDTILICEVCGYAANQQIAEFKKKPLPSESPKIIENIPTPGVTTIADLSEFLEIPVEKIAKAIILIAINKKDTGDEEEPIFAVVRGDMNLNLTKLANLLRVDELRPAEEKEIWNIGAVPGYASALEIKNARMVVDDLVPLSTNLVAGANQEGFHFLNVNYGRDFTADLIADIVIAEEGHTCPRCDGSLSAHRGVEVGNIFKLGTRYSEAMNCYYTNENGELIPVSMGSYGIGSGRLLASVAEGHNDNNGLILPITIAPYQVHLITLADRSVKNDSAEKESETSVSLKDRAELLYTELLDEGVEVLYDDRDLSPGIKFADADLIGIPIRITVSRRSLNQDGYELKLRNSEEKRILKSSGAVQQIKEIIRELTDILNKNIPDKTV